MIFFLPLLLFMWSRSWDAGESQEDSWQQPAALLERGGRCSPPTLGSPSTKIHYCFPLLYRCFTEPCAMPSKRKPSNTLGYRTQLLSAAGWTQLWVHVPGEKISGLNRISNDVSLMEPTALQAFRITSLLLGSTGAGRKTEYK